jgi:hypothetical protein
MPAWGLKQRERVSVHRFKGSGFRGSTSDANLNRRRVKPELFLRHWVEKQIHGTAGLFIRKMAEFLD